MGIARRQRLPGAGTILSPRFKPRQQTVGVPMPADTAPVVVGDHRGENVYRFIVGGPIIEPAKIDCPTPVYPDDARRQGIEGVVVLQTVVSSTGEVAHAKVVRGVHGGLTEAAVAAVGQWRFEPARLDGEPVAVSYILAIRFRLDAERQS